MRVLVVSDLYPPIAFGGYERTCATLVEGLRERHAVTVLTSDLRAGQAPARAWVRRELAYLGPERREALRVPGAAVRAAAVTRRVVAETRPDIVYVSNCLGISQAAPCAAVAAGFPVMYRLSELWFASTLYRGDRFVGYLDGGPRGLRRPWSWLVRSVNRHPELRLDPTRPSRAAVSWSSEELRARVTLPRGVEPVLERTIHPGVGGPFATTERRPSSPPTIVYAGRVTTAKGAEVAVQALGSLRASHGIDARLVLAGHCRRDMERRLTQLAGRLGIVEHVELVGLLDSDALARLFARARALVVPTVAHEVFGRVTVEAALARLPVVASRIGGLPEALHDGEHALLFTPGDADACATALADVLRHPAAAEARAGRAFGHVQQFSADRFVAAEEAFMREAVEVLGAR